MAPKLMLPVDFGIENLHSEFHNNVVFKLEGGEEMRANSLILSFHSSEFVRLFLELNQSILEMDDFSKESVKSFLEALYSGEIQLDRNLFRDVNKMCHVFKVDWLSRRCGEYFEGLVGDIRPSTDYQTLLFLFEEARFSVKVMKCDKMMDTVVQKLCRVEDTAEIFAERYMKNFKELGTGQLDLMLQITRKNPVPLLKILKKNLESKGMVFDDVSRYLLEKIDLCKCIYYDKAFFEETFDLLDNVTYSSDSDALSVNKLYRKSLKEFKNRKKSLLTSSDAGSSSNSPDSSTNIPHVFSSFESFRGLSPTERFERLKESPLVTNLYMLIEGLVVEPHFRVHGVTAEMVEDMEEIRRQRSWSRISPEFLKTTSIFYGKALRTISSYSTDLKSNDESVKRVGKPVDPDNIISKSNSFTVVHDLFFTPLTFAFYYRHPTTNNCDKPGKCGFIIKFLPDVKSGQPYKFKANLCLDQEKYPQGLHIHPEFVQPDKIHLIPMIPSKEGGRERGMDPYYATITWNEFGVSHTGIEEPSSESEEDFFESDDDFSVSQDSSINGTERWYCGTAALDPTVEFKMAAFITV